MDKKDEIELPEGKDRFVKDRLNGMWVNGMADSSVLAF